MGGRLSPPKDELFDPVYAKKEDKSDLWWRNILENPITVQFNHRCLVSSSRWPARSVLIRHSGYHDLCLYRSPLRFVLEPKDESGSHSNGQEDGQVRFSHGKCPSRVGNIYPPLSCPHPLGSFASSWERSPPYHHDPSADQSAPTSGCCKTLASSQRCKNSRECSCIMIYPASFTLDHRGSHFVLYKSIIFPSPPRVRGGLIKHASQLISLVVGHLDINISRRGRGSGDWRCFDLFRDHGLQVNVDFLVLVDTETSLGGDSHLVHSCWTKNAY